MGETLRTRREVLQGLTTAIAAASAVVPAADAHGKSRTPRASRRPNIVVSTTSDPDENHNLHGKKGFEPLTAQLRSRLEELRRETGDSYRYTPSRTSFLVAQYGPTERPEPWRPNRS